MSFFQKCLSRPVYLSPVSSSCKPFTPLGLQPLALSRGRRMLHQARLLSGGSASSSSVDPGSKYSSMRVLSAMPYGSAGSGAGSGAGRFQFPNPMCRLEVGALSFRGGVGAPPLSPSRVFFRGLATSNDDDNNGNNNNKGGQKNQKVGGQQAVKAASGSASVPAVSSSPAVPAAPPSGVSLEEGGESLSDIQILTKLSKYLWPADNPEVRVRVVAAGVLLASAKLLSISVPIVMKLAVDALAVSADPLAAAATAAPTLPSLLHGIPFAAGLPPIEVGAAALIAAYGAAKAGTSIFSEVRNIIFSKVAQGAIRHLSVEVFAHLLRLDMQAHLSRQTGAVSRVIDRGIRGINFILSSMIFNVVPTVFEMMVVTYVLSHKCGPELGAVTLGTLTAYAVFTLSVTTWRTEFRKRMNRAESAASASAVDSLLNYEAVKLYAAEKHEVARYEHCMRNYEEAATNTSQSLSMLNLGQQTIFAMGLTAGMLLTAQKVKEGQASVGDLVMVNAMLFQLSMPLNFLGTVFRETKQSLVDMGALFKLLQERAFIQDPAPEATNHLPPGTGADGIGGVDIELRDVHFSYRADDPILQGVSLHVPAGTSCAIVGPSGSGKSTLLRLLVRFYEAEKGSVRVGGSDVRSLMLSELRGCVAKVPQDMPLFNESVFYNIAYGKKGATKAEVEAAARAAHIHDAIMSMPDGYGTRVGERGLRLSGGEKQRVAIARAFLKAPRVLLFDEATSALDAHTEAHVIEAMRSLAEGRTSIVVAHRLSTAACCDQIVVLDNGRVAESGSHADLIAKGGRYAALWARQANVDDLQSPAAAAVAAAAASNACIKEAI